MRKRAKEIVEKIQLGWNLGNYFDCTTREYTQEQTKALTCKEVTSLWGNPNFKLECIDQLLRMGVNCLRIPVTWCNFAYKDGNKYLLSQDIFQEIKTIVDYALVRGFVVIVDMHHDDQCWLSVAGEEEEFELVKDEFCQLWKIIAENFKDYEDNLILEGMNEIIDRSNPEKYDWCGEKDIFFSRLNSLYKDFVSTVRMTGGNNSTRPLMISTYGAQVHRRAFEKLVLPEDDNIILDVHYYSSCEDLEKLLKYFNRIKHYSAKNNIPVILGECGLKKGIGEKELFKTNYLQQTQDFNIKCLLWDNGKNRRMINRGTADIEPEWKCIFEELGLKHQR